MPLFSRGVDPVHTAHAGLLQQRGQLSVSEDGHLVGRARKRRVETTTRERRIRIGLARRIGHDHVVELQTLGKRQIEQDHARSRKLLIRMQHLDPLVEDCLRRAALWDEVKDELSSSALGLSGGQQQRLCIARALATDPEVLLMDDPCSALDPISTNQIEQTIRDLTQSMTVVIVTHNMQQATRVSDFTMFMLRESMAEPAHLVESGTTEQVFSKPVDKRTEDYITGHFG